jgi:hypothetical protein
MIAGPIDQPADADCYIPGRGWGALPNDGEDL